MLFRLWRILSRQVGSESTPEDRLIPRAPSMHTPQAANREPCSVTTMRLSPPFLATAGTSISESVGATESHTC